MNLIRGVFEGTATEFNPSNIELEQQVLGAVFSNHTLLDELVQANLQPWHFCEEHEDIWRVILEHHERGVPPHYSVVIKRFPSETVWPGGLTTKPYFARLVADAATTTIKEVVLEKARAVKARAEALQTRYAYEDLQKAFAAGADEQSAMMTFLEKVDAIREGLMNDVNRNTTKDLGELTEGIGDEVRRLRAAYEQGKSAAAANALMCGIKEIDDLGGFFPGDLVVVSARPSNLKSTLADTISLQAARVAMGPQGNHEHGFGKLQLEMSDDQIKWRQITDMVHFLYGKGLDYESLRRGQGVDSALDLDLIDSAQRELAITPCVVDVCEDLTVPQVAAKARILDKRLFRKFKRRLRLLVIDQASYLKPTVSLKGNTAQEIDDICRDLKRLAKQMGLTVLLLNQQRRVEKDAKDKRPTLSGQKNSGAYEEKADITILLHYEASYLSGEAGDKMGEAELKAALEQHANTLEVRVGKNRMGRKPRFTLYVNAGAGAVRSSRDNVPPVGGPVQYADDKEKAAHKAALDHFGGESSF